MRKKAGSGDWISIKLADVKGCKEKISVSNSERAVTVLYEDSECHTKFQSKYSKMEKIFGGIAHVYTLGVPYLLGYGLDFLTLMKFVFIVRGHLEVQFVGTIRGLVNEDDSKHFIQEDELKEEEQEVSVTKRCELISNEAIISVDGQPFKLRVLDAAGFSDSQTLRKVTGHRVGIFKGNLQVIRWIVRVQAEFGLTFRRIQHGVQLLFLTFENRKSLQHRGRVI